MRVVLAHTMALFRPYRLISKVKIARGPRSKTTGQSSGAFVTHSFLARAFSFRVFSPVLIRLSMNLGRVAQQRKMNSPVVNSHDRVYRRGCNLRAVAST